MRGLLTLRRAQVNWPLELRVLGDYPGVGEGARSEPDVDPSVYVDPGSRFEEPVETEITPEEARSANAEARACIAQARRENRDYTKDWANWMSILLLGTAGIAIYHDLRQRRASDSDGSS